MSLHVGLLGQVESTSALRYGFAGLEPISIKSTIRKFGLKITGIQWHFEKRETSLDFVENYPSYLKSVNALVMEKVKLPARIDPVALTHELNQITIDNFEKDKDLKSALKKVEHERESARPFLEFAKFMRKRYEEKEDEVARTRTQMFSCSNLPFSFFTDFSMSDQIYGGFLDAFQHKTSLYESVWLHKYVDNQRLFKERFEEMKKSLQPLFDVMESSYFIRKCLGVLVLASNLEDATSSSSLEFIDLHKVDFEQFSKLSTELRESLDQCVSVILSIEPNAFTKMPSSDLREVFVKALQ